MIQPGITKKSTFTTVLINFLIVIIPFGILYVLIIAVLELTKSKVAIYEQEPIRVRDRRYNVGYRIEGWKKEKTGQKRELSEEEKTASRYNGRLRIYALILFFAFGGILYYFETNK
jgi:hypothetical protein